jgi:antitoxin component YwqK of YwqJK toxin-antitoxin module
MKYIFSILLFLSFSEALHAQQKIYFDEYWEVTTIENMEYYRETYKEGNLIRIKDFYKNGQVQMDALASDASIGNEVFEGEVKLYHPNGKVETIENYKNGKSVGIYKTFDQEGRIIKDYNYTESGIFSGKFYTYKNESTTFNSISEFENGAKLKTSYFGNDFSMLFKEVYPNDQYKYETKFYDEKGNFIGTYFGKESYAQKGILVEYFSNPLRVRNSKEFNTTHELRSILF